MGESAPPQGPSCQISWGAVFSGTIVWTALMFTLSKLCLAVDLGLMKPEEPGRDQLVPLIAGAGAVAWILSLMLATFVGAWIASHLARQRRQIENILHGLLVWGLGIVILIILAATTTGILVSGASSLIGSAMDTPGTAVASVPQDATAAPASSGESAKTARTGKARDVAGIAARAACSASWMAFVGAALAAGVAVVGAYLGGRLCGDGEHLDGLSIRRL